MENRLIFMPLTVIGNEGEKADRGGKYNNEFAFGHVEIEIFVGIFR